MNTCWRESCKFYSTECEECESCINQNNYISGYDEVSFKDKLKSLPEDMLVEFSKTIVRYPKASVKSLWVSIIDTYIE